MHRYDPVQALAAAAAESICHCGRLKRFWRCCQPYTAEQREHRMATLSLHDRSLATVGAVKYFFGDSPERLKDNVTNDRVREFYRFISDVWTARMHVPSFLRSLDTSEGNAGYYVGWVRPETILRALTRVALYSDRIFVPQPFHLPWSLREEYDPVNHPGPVRIDTHRWATVILYLEPWIRAGFVTLVPDPCDYDPTLREAFFVEGRRREAEGRVRVDPADINRHLGIFKEEFIREFYSLPDEVIIRRLRETADLSDADAPSMLEYIKAQRDVDPYYIKGAFEGEGILQRMSISTIEETILTCGLTRAFPFTDMRGKWSELLEAADDLPDQARVWTPLSNAFSRLRFDFLDGYNARLAFEIRDDGRLIGFRNFLHEVWKSIDGSPSVHAAEKLARDLSDRLTWEHKVAKSEWSVIRRKYEGAVKKSAVETAIGGVAASFTTGVVGVAFSLGLHLFKSQQAQKDLATDLAAFHTKCPISLFIEIEAAQVHPF